MFLIKNMVDEMEYVDARSGTHLRMVVKLPTDTHGQKKEMD